VSSVGEIDSTDVSVGDITRDDVDKNAVRCPDSAAAAEMESAIKAARDEGDSLGGIVTCVCRNVSVGWGEPVFDKMEARLASAMLSIPAAKGFDVGSGFAGTRMRGSAHNDVFVKKGDGLGTATNRSGGIQGGITNGEPIVMRVAFKPTASIATAQKTADYNGGPAVLELKGRHDPCVLPRAVPVVEAMAAIVLADMALIAD
jgi:chorismate synthase